MAQEPSKTHRIIIAGAPASGKGTQCEMIKAKYGVVHISTGDSLRAAVKAGTERGLAAKKFMDAGQLVPDDLIIALVKERLDSDDCRERGWLLDGFPRTKAQADALAAAGIEATAFVLLEVPSSILVDRVTGRRTDPVTGTIYHLTFSPPESKEVADRLVQRSDDTEEKVKVRIKAFDENVKAIRESYAGILLAVDGNRDKKEIFKDICNGLYWRRGDGKW